MFINPVCSTNINRVIKTNENSIFIEDKGYDQSMGKSSFLFFQVDFVQKNQEEVLFER